MCKLFKNNRVRKLKYVNKNTALFILFLLGSTKYQQNYHKQYDVINTAQIICKHFIVSQNSVCL